MLRREQIERLKERYPAGTVVRLGQMEGEHQMPSGMEGKVIGVDDIGQIHVEWENGSTLALNVEEDDFTVVPQKETLSEKKCREFLGKINEILKETDFYLLNVSCNGGIPPMLPKSCLPCIRHLKPCTGKDMWMRSMGW
jgi:hypothetical protein